MRRQIEQLHSVSVRGLRGIWIFTDPQWQESSITWHHPIGLVDGPVVFQTNEVDGLVASAVKAIETTEELHARQAPVRAD